MSKSETVSIQVYWELRNGTWCRYEEVLGSPEYREQLVDKRGFTSAIRKLKRAGVIETV